MGGTRNRQGRSEGASGLGRWAWLQHWCRHCHWAAQPSRTGGPAGRCAGVPPCGLRRGRSLPRRP
eukprot:3786395-Lingulodinium_polyedra.AAC.1